MYEKTKKWSYIDVVLWSFMVGAGESYIGAFSLSLGYSERYAGLISVIPLGLASILQLFAPHALPFFKNRRLFVVAFAVLQALILFQFQQFRQYFPDNMKL